MESVDKEIMAIKNWEANSLLFRFIDYLLFMSEKDVRKLIREALNQLDEARIVTYPSEILSKIGKEVGGIKTIDIQTMGDGATGLYRYEKDGNAYEIQIRPAGLVKYKERWGKRMIKKDPNPLKAAYNILNKGAK